MKASIEQVKSYCEEKRVTLRTTLNNMTESDEKRTGNFWGRVKFIMGQQNEITHIMEIIESK